MLLSFIGFSQNPVSLVLSKPNSTFSYKASSFKLKDVSFALNLSDRKSYADKYFLSVYNPTTQLNDNYVKVSNAYHITNYKSFTSYNFNGMKKDSFNPNGVSDMGSALGIGFLNLLFEKF